MLIYNLFYLACELAWLTFKSYVRVANPRQLATLADSSSKLCCKRLWPKAEPDCRLFPTVIVSLDHKVQQ